MKRFQKIMAVIICWMLLCGFLIYETYSIVKKEYLRQTDVAIAVHEKVNLNLDMIKIGVLSGEVETYVENLAEAEAQKDVISSLGLIKNDQADYLQKLSDYTEILHRKESLLREMQNLKAEVLTIKDKINENYGDKDTLTRDKLKEVKDKIAELKIKTDNYTEEGTLKVANGVNGVLDDIIDKASALADCIDACYKNRIDEINDELADKIKAFADGVAELNQSFEREFDFEKMAELRQ